MNRQEKRLLKRLGAAPEDARDAVEAMKAEGCLHIIKGEPCGARATKVVCGLDTSGLVRTISVACDEHAEHAAEMMAKAARR